MVPCYPNRCEINAIRERPGFILIFEEGFTVENGLLLPSGEYDLRALKKRFRSSFKKKNRSPLKDTIVDSDIEKMVEESDWVKEAREQLDITIEGAWNISRSVSYVGRFG